MKKDKLHNINSAGFKTPDNYFDTFDNQLIQRIKEKSSLEGIESPGFEVPKDYFNTIDDSILNAVNDQVETPVVSLFKRKQLYYMSGIAASLLLLISIFNYQSTTEDISIELVENYFIESDLDTYDLAELLVDANILEDDFNLIETTYEEENLEEYLLENADIEAILQ